MIRVGKIAATRGLGGALVLQHIVGRQGWLATGTPLFVELRRESYIPYFVEKISSLSDDQELVHFEDVGSIEAAKPLVGKAAYVEEAVLHAAADPSLPLRWIGYNVVDKALGPLGPLTDVYQAGPQWLGRLERAGEEVLIPLVDAFILDLNHRARYIRLDLPEGLIEP